MINLNDVSEQAALPNIKSRQYYWLFINTDNNKANTVPVYALTNGTIVSNSTKRYGPQYLHWHLDCYHVQNLSLFGTCYYIELLHVISGFLKATLED